jgi:hypothetical protein
MIEIVIIYPHLNILNLLLYPQLTLPGLLQCLHSSHLDCSFPKAPNTATPPRLMPYVAITLKLLRSKHVLHHNLHLKGSFKSFRVPSARSKVLIAMSTAYLPSCNPTSSHACGIPFTSSCSEPHGLSSHFPCILLPIHLCPFLMLLFVTSIHLLKLRARVTDS